MLLHNGNKYPSLPLAHSVHLKEDYNSINTLLDALKYDEYDWDPRKVLMPPLHIKLGLMKQFVRTLDTESAAFKDLQDFFPKLSEAKVKAGVFVGPQIKKILECNEFLV